MSITCVFLGCWRHTASPTWPERNEIPMSPCFSHLSSPPPTAYRSVEAAWLRKKTKTLDWEYEKPFPGVFLGIVKAMPLLHLKQGVWGVEKVSTSISCVCWWLRFQAVSGILPSQASGKRLFRACSLSSVVSQCLESEEFLTTNAFGLSTYIFTWSGIKSTLHQRKSK